MELPPKQGMDSSLCADLLRHILCDHKKVGYAPKNTIDWLETLELPLQLLRFMQWRWVLQNEQMGSVTVWPAATTHTDKITPHLLRHKMLLLGCASNADLFVVNFSTSDCRPGFVSHDSWSPFKSLTPPPFEPIGRIFDSWFYRIAEGLFVPMDYPAAKRFNDFLKAENRPA